MPIKFEIEAGKGQIEIGEFTADGGRKYVSINKFYRAKDGKYYPAKYKSKGGSIFISLPEENWEEIIPRMSQFLGIPNNQPQREETQPEPKDDF